MPSVSEILLQHGRDVANAAATRGAARASIGLSLGALPGQIINNYQQMTEFAAQREAEKTAQKTAEANATTAQVNARTATTNERDVNAYKDIIAKLPKVTENGLQLTDVEALNRELTAARIDPAPYVQHAQAMNTAFRAEYAARQELIKTGADQVARAGNNPAFADDTVDGLVRNKLITADEAQKYKNFYTYAEDGSPLPFDEQVNRVGQLTKYLGNKRAGVTVGAGAQRFDEVTNEPLGTQVPKVETTEEKALRIGSLPETQRTPADQAWFEAYDKLKAPTTQSQMMRLEGVGDVPITIVPTRGDPTKPRFFYQGQDVSDKVRAIPPQPPSVNANVPDVVQSVDANGNPIWIRKADAPGQPTSRAVTGAEHAALGFYNRARSAVETLTKPGENGGPSIEQEIANAGTLSQGRLQLAPNFLQSERNQSYRQAQRAFTEARLRKESGAAINPKEYETDSQTYFAQPGDGPKIIKQKAAARQVVLDSLKAQAGRAYQEYYGEPNVSPVGAGGDRNSRAAEVLRTNGKASDPAAVETFLKNNPTFR